ncbi:MAG: hypothetical protein ACXIUQ_20035 [Cecembia sp.]
MKTKVLKISLLILAFVFVGNAYANNHSKMNPYDEETLSEIVLEIQEIEQSPTVTLINKYGEVVAQLYGNKSVLETKFAETLEKATFILKHGDHHFYLID